MAEYKENKVQRRPFPEGTQIDVVMRLTPFHGPHSRVFVDEEAGTVEVIGTLVGDPITDWKINGEPGDILKYRKHEETTDE